MHQSLSRWYRIACASVFASGPLACSLSYQSVYESDVRFEHCYRLDEERQVPIAQKRTCWRAWVAKHTYGQTRDRVEYALERDRTLERAEASGERSAPPGAAGAKLPIASPQPTSAFVSPPQTMASAHDAGAPDADRSPTVAALIESAAGAFSTGAPGATCGGACGRAWAACGEPCKSANPCQSTCDEHYRVCMRRCF
ncbi:MAG TPA: hypothetical protein VJT73_12350 [Polyangiaceae bacterium]|nr:hypothetical protein [Polyangiaceae bacterium]